VAISGPGTGIDVSYAQFAPYSQTNQQLTEWISLGVNPAQKRSNMEGGCSSRFSNAIILLIIFVSRLYPLRKSRNPFCCRIFRQRIVLALAFTLDLIFRAFFLLLVLRSEKLISLSLVWWEGHCWIDRTCKYLECTIRYLEPSKFKSQ
jgi:hypothetical protein